MTISAKDAVTQTFLAYSQTFETMVKNNDPNLILPFFNTSALLIAPNQAPAFLNSTSEITQLFTLLIQQLQTVGFDHSKLNSITTKLLSPTVGLVSGTATRYGDQDESKILEVFGFTYTLYQSDTNWKIITGIIHLETTALILNPV